MKLDGARYENLQNIGSENYFLHDFPTDYWSGKLNICTRGEGSWVWDGLGNRLLDMLGGLWYKGVGYGRREIADAMHAQIVDGAENAYAHSATPVQLDLAARLAGLAGKPDGRVYFTTGGSDANEAAVKMACRYQQLTGKPRAYKVIARRGSYHGSTALCVSLGQAASTDNMGVLVPGVINVTNWNSYRLPYKGDALEVAEQCAAEVEQAIIHANPDTVAAILTEPISAAAGLHVPPLEYWQRLREIADKYGVVLIADEVITGFGRTGKPFCLMNWGVEADIVVVAKAITSGYAPLGAAIVDRKVADAFVGGAERQFKHIVTYGGHPVACAAAMANFDIMERENLFYRAGEMAPIMRAGLLGLMEKYEIVGDVRGIGLLWALELVQNRATKQHFAPETNLSLKLYEILIRNGLTNFRAGNVVPICPPLTFGEDEAAYLFDALDKSLDELSGELARNG